MCHFERTMSSLGSQRQTLATARLLLRYCTVTVSVCVHVRVRVSVSVSVYIVFLIFLSIFYASPSITRYKLSLQSLMQSIRVADSSVSEDPC